MILVLKKIVPTDYVLSRQTGSYNRQRFSDLPTNVKVGGSAGADIDMEERRRAGVWQLVPWVFSMADEPETPSEYDYRENGYWHISRALQMSTADPHHQYDQYNDATQYRVTGELMEISFQPLFIEGVTNGSSKRVIQKKAGYPMDKETLGIGSVLNTQNGRFMYQNNVSGPQQARTSLAGVAAGPSPAAWKTYLLSQMQNKKRALRTSTVERSVAPRTSFATDISTTATKVSAATAEVSATADPTQIDRLQSALDGVGAGGATNKRNVKGGMGAAKRAAAAAAAAAVSATTSLSSSYIQNSGGGGENSGGLVGTVRASLLSSAPEAPEASSPPK